MTFYHLSLPDDVENPNTWAASIYHVFAGPPEHMVWVDHIGREQQALRDMSGSRAFPTHLFSALLVGVMSQALLKEPALTVTLAVAAAIASEIFSIFKRERAMSAMTVETTTRLENMYYQIFCSVMNDHRIMNLYGREYRLPGVEQIRPPVVLTRRRAFS